MDQSSKNKATQVQRNPSLSTCRSILMTHNPPPDHSHLKSTPVPSLSSPTSVIEQCSPGTLHRRRGCGKSVLQTELPHPNHPRITRNMKWKIRCRPRPRNRVIANDDVETSDPKDIMQTPASTIYFPKLDKVSSPSIENPIEDSKENSPDSSPSIEHPIRDPEENILEYKPSLAKQDLILEM